MSETKTTKCDVVFKNICDKIYTMETVEVILSEDTRRIFCDKINDFNRGGIICVTDYINTSSIASKLINEAGRWCDRYASDFIIDWDHVRCSIACALSDDNNADLKENGYREVVLFGMRESGIDHSSYVYSKMSDRSSSINDYYARIYAVDISLRYEDYHYHITIGLKDIKSQVAMAAYDMRKEL